MVESARLRVAVGAVRSQALDLLTEASRGQTLGHHDSALEAVARLQRVANDLGFVFSTLPADAGGPGDDPLVGLDPAPSRHAAAAMILGSITVSPEAPQVDQAERWLRILRLHGRTAETLQRIGLRERPLATVAEPSRRFRGPGQQEVIRRAAELARTAGSQTTDTVHVLFAVRAVFGSALDRALYDGGTAWSELTDALVTVAEAETVR